MPRLIEFAPRLCGALNQRCKELRRETVELALAPAYIAYLNYCGLRPSDLSAVEFTHLAMRAVHAKYIDVRERREPHSPDPVAYLSPAHGAQK